MEKIKCITFDKAAQDVLPEHIKAKMKANMSKARREEYKKLCYNFEYKFGSNIPHCAKKWECDEDCEYMRNFKK
ncbi:hypothetical protein [Bacteroides clarus]|uniref:hypothetical protein n=1 Tax=Bacteroides clarus TaxID=626929 RepID=UPI00204DBC56|nr:hypothetical protein [Bacteroides clarus]DAZ80184.1 MAG TPA: hypothetical protein [Caudoviricetes sp.]